MYKTMENRGALVTERMVGPKTPPHRPGALYTYSLKITGLRLWGLLTFCMLLSLCVSVSFCLFLSFSPSFVFSSFLVYPGQMSICFKSHIEFKDTNKNKFEVNEKTSITTSLTSHSFASLLVSLSDKETTLNIFSYCYWYYFHIFQWNA